MFLEEEKMLCTLYNKIGIIRHYKYNMYFSGLLWILKMSIEIVIDLSCYMKVQKAISTWGIWGVNKDELD